MTALTFTDTLSFVMTSCGGTSMAMVLRLTLTSLSTRGIITTTPGPFPPTMPRAILPNRNTTARSYSRSTWNPMATSRPSRIRIAIGLISRFMSGLSLFRCGFDVEFQAIYTRDLGGIARLQGLVADRVPEFTAHEKLPLWSQGSFGDSHQ